MEFKKNQWYEREDYGKNEGSYKYVKVDDIIGNRAYYTKFTENLIEGRKDWFEFSCFENIYKELPKTLQTLCVGDMVFNGTFYRKVLGVINQNCYIVGCASSDINSEHLEKISVMYSSKDLENNDYKPYTEEKEETKEMTVKEISDKLGFEVKIIKE